MTRINLDSPYTIPDQHLIAEYRELPRVFTLTMNAQARGHSPSTYGIPATFRLGAGHMKFFADKLGYLHERYMLIVQECLSRGFNIQHLDLRPEFFSNIRSEWFGYYTPTEGALSLSRARLQEKYALRPNFYTLRGLPYLP